MNIGDAKKRLEAAAKEFVTSGRVESLFTAALDYSRAKHRGWKNRDSWKVRKRLGNGTQQ